MDRRQAQNIIKETFENRFDKEKFTYFVKNLLNNIIDAPFTYRGNYVPDSFEPFISCLERIGKYYDGNHKIDVLIVQLKKETSLDRARTMQRNFIAWYLNGSRGGELKDAALVAFVSPDEEDWRFSLVKMDYKFEQVEQGKLKIKEDMTPAKRWSFLVGRNETSHTAQSRLVNILANDEQNPTLKQLEEAFNIETVTKEFFLRYRDLFIRTKEELDKIVLKNSIARADFEAKGVDTVNFAKKLLGQIIFLYFLQKKGWFGVDRDAPWGSGSKHFLRELFEKWREIYGNFFDKILEPLFYDVLRNDRSHIDHYYSPFNCKIPFLNGGLFDPIGNYDWIHTDILLPDSLFSNKKSTKEGDIGDGILDIFDRYNFTAKEDEPLEKEVAIDPELLGKAYEKFNAIRPDNFEEYLKALRSGNKGEEVKFNKQFGVYYTPREIVHYMCQQSLKNYIATELEGKLTGEEIEILIKSGEDVIENEKIVIDKGKETKIYSFKLPESIRENAKLIDDALSNIIVCDPAVGSGAFPVGLMSEIVRVRNVLSIFMRDEQRNTYDFKRRCIEHSLYGVDIDPGAVEIAKLRLWLSLIVEEDDIKNIKPLPNLDYKVVCGNSLLGVEKNLFNNQLFIELEALKPCFFNETNPIKKQECKKQIDELISQISNGHKDFDFAVYFSEVFHEKGGFDIVIGNPPYGADLKNSEKKILDLKFNELKTNTKNSAIYFIYKSGDQLNVKGINSFIIPKSICYSNGWIKCAEFIIDSGLCKLIDAGKAFENVKLEMVIFISNKNYKDSYFINGIFEDEKINEYEKVTYDYFKRYGILFAGQNKAELKLIRKISSLTNRWGDYFYTARGANWQSRAAINKGQSSIYRGAQLNKWFLSDPTDFIDISKFNEQEYFYLMKPKILNQLAIAHVMNPYPHFFLQAMYDDMNRLVYETIACTFGKIEEVDLKFGLAINNSKLFAWFLYKMIYSNAIRSTRYDEIYVSKIPVPNLTAVNQKPFIEIVEKILIFTQSGDYLQNPQTQANVKALEQEIDQMVYELYGLTKEEIRIVECGTENTF